MLLVLTPAYTIDLFGDFVYLLANYHGRQQGTWPVLPLLLKPVELPLRLAHLVPVNAIETESRPAALDRIAALLGTAIQPGEYAPPYPYPGSDKQSSVRYKLPYRNQGLAA